MKLNLNGIEIEVQGPADIEVDGNKVVIKPKDRVVEQHHHHHYSTPIYTHPSIPVWPNRPTITWGTSSSKPMTSSYSVVAAQQADDLISWTQ